MRIFIITRVKGEKGIEAVLEKNISKFIQLECVSKAIIITDVRKKTIKVNSKEIEFIYDQDSSSPVSFNKTLKLLDNCSESSENLGFFNFSPEVEIDKDNINELVEIMQNFKGELLVVGYKLRDNILSDRELEQCDSGGIAFRVPWNTCALWNYNLFKKYVEIFDPICDSNNNTLGNLEVKFSGKIITTKYKGMEDGLAIAKALTKNKNIKSLLLKKSLNWNIPHERENGQKEKLARKNIVLSTFMNIKGYSIDKLNDAAVEGN